MATRLCHRTSAQVVVRCAVKSSFRSSTKRHLRCTAALAKDIDSQENTPNMRLAPRPRMANSMCFG